MSTDDVDTLRRFREANDAPFPMASDADKSITRAYGVRRRFPWPSTKRVTFVISSDATIQGTFHHEISIGQHVGDVVDCLRKLETAKPGEVVCR